jgi:LPXTG-site transpeptidase (sortase) family protein
MADQETKPTTPEPIKPEVATVPKVASLNNLPDDISFVPRSHRGLVIKILKQAAVLIALAVFTLLILYWQLIYKQMDYWWRHRTTTEVVSDRPNSLFPGNKASFQINDSHNQEEVIPLDNRIVIDKIEVNAPIVDIPTYDDNDVLNAIQNGVGHYPDTAYPGEGGNVFLTGHSSFWWWDKGQYKFVFQHLEDLVIGDKITVYYNQKRYDYIVKDMQVVKPKGPHVVDLFNQDEYKDHPVLRIMTCTPVGTSLNRLIVTAEQTNFVPPVQTSN